MRSEEILDPGMDALNERFTPAAAAWENLEAPGLDGRRWFVVHTQPHNEMRAVANLHQQDFSTFCPSLRRTVRHARQVKTVLAPLFPNYIFVQLDTAIDRWRCINGTRGVVRLITQGDHPVPVPQCIVEDLQLRTASDGAVDWAASFKLGDAVMIADGPFAKFVGTLERLDAAGRVQVLLDLLGRSVRVSVRGQAISPVL